MTSKTGPARESFALVLMVLLHAGLFLALGPALLEAFPLDDAYTHHVYAEGLRYGDGLSYLPGTPAAGSTSPLQAMLLVPVQLAPLDALVPLTHALGVLGWVLLAFATRRLTRLLVARSSASGVGASAPRVGASPVGARADAATRSMDAGSLAAFAIALDPSLAAVALSGMEVILAALLLVLALVALAEDRPKLAGLLFGLGILARPELTLVWLAASGLVLRRDRPAALAVALPGVLAWSAWAAWNHHAAGTLLPTTFFAKHGALSILDRWRDFPRAIAQTMGAWSMVATIPLVWLGARRLLESSGDSKSDSPIESAKISKSGSTSKVDARVERGIERASDSRTESDELRSVRVTNAARTVGLLVVVLTILWPLGIAWAHDLRETWRLYWWRYALPAHPLVWVLVVVGIRELTPARRRFATAATLVVLVAGSWSTANHVGQSAKNVLELNVAAARYLDAHADPNDWIASNDAGAVRRWTGRPVVDLLGLNDAEVLVDRAAVLQRRRPRWYVVFPSWFPGLVASPRYELVRRFRSEPLAICGECEQSELVILRTRE